MPVGVLWVPIGLLCVFMGTEWGGAYFDHAPLSCSSSPTLRKCRGSAALSGWGEWKKVGAAMGWGVMGWGGSMRYKASLCTHIGPTDLEAAVVGLLLELWRSCPVEVGRGMERLPHSEQERLQRAMVRPPTRPIEPPIETHSPISV